MDSAEHSHNSQLTWLTIAVGTHARWVARVHRSMLSIARWGGLYACLVPANS